MADLKIRTKEFALNIIKLQKEIPSNKIADVLNKQLLRSSTSVTANYRAACRARSHAEFISKVGIVEEEADESAFWLELISESNTYNSDLLQALLKESKELTAIFTSSGKTAKANKVQNKKVN
jgi:four helix bundle protein